MELCHVLVVNCRSSTHICMCHCCRHLFCIQDIEAKIGAGDFGPVVAWLRREIHARGQLKTARELLNEITGEPLNIRYFKEHLERRYLG